MKRSITFAFAVALLAATAALFTSQRTFAQDEVKGPIDNRNGGLEKLAASAAVAQGGDAPADTPEIKELRDGLIDAFNKRDVDRMMTYLHPNIIVTWQDATISKGHDGVRAYYAKMMTGPNAIVKEMGSDPKIEGRKVFGDTSISYGTLNDWFKLNDGLEVHLNSRFSAHLTKGPDGKWLVSGFHASANAFENEVTKVVAKKVGTYAGGIGGVVGLLVGLLIGRVMGKRSARTA